MKFGTPRWVGLGLAFGAAARLAIGCASSSASAPADAGSDVGADAVADAGADAVPAPGSGVHDAAVVTFDGAPGAYGFPCESGAACDSGVCFSGGMRTFCSYSCQTGTDCPMPPTSGVCNMMGYCRYP